MFSVLSLFKPGSAPLRNALQVVACCLDVPLFSSRRRESASGHTLSPLGRGRTRGEARARPRAHDPGTRVKILNTTMKSEKCRPNQTRMGDRLTNCAVTRGVRCGTAAAAVSLLVILVIVASLPSFVAACCCWAAGLLLIWGRVIKNELSL